MIGIVLALLATVAYASTKVLVRKGLEKSNFFSATLVVTVTGIIILWPLALLFTNLRTVNLEGVLFFVMAGLLAPGIARLLYFKGMQVVGVSVNTSISVAYPLYSSIFAVLLLGENLTLENWVGIVCILAGAVSIQSSLSNPKTGPERISKKGLTFPLLASFAVALSLIIMKHGLNIFDEPLLGSAIGNSSTFVLYLPMLISSYTMRGSLRLGKDFRLFWKAGACLSFGWISSFYALSHERVSIVTSLLVTEPLFVFFFASLYLKELEHISFKLVTGALLIVVGTMLVTIW